MKPNKYNFNRPYFPLEIRWAIQNGKKSCMKQANSFPVAGLECTQLSAESIGKFVLMKREEMSKKGNVKQGGSAS